MNLFLLTGVSQDEAIEGMKLFLISGQRNPAERLNKGCPKELISELADALERFQGYGAHLTQQETDLIRRAREIYK